MTDYNIATLVAGLKPRRYTVTQAAALVGRSPDTLRRWRLTGTYVPSNTMAFGHTEVFLYTDKDIAAMKKVAAEQKPGRKKSNANPS